MPEHDVFLSYARADAAQVHRLAENLHNAGVDVFLDAWEIAPGDVLVHQLDRGIRDSRNGILAVTPVALSRPWVLEEYAAMLTRAVEGKQRLIPVLLADTEMPPLLASRVYVDLRRDGSEYEQEVRKLIAFLKGERPGPPPRIEPRPDTAIRREEVISRRLRIGREKVTLLNQEAVEAEHRPQGLSYRTEHQLLWDLERLRHQRLPEESQLYRAPGAAGAPAQESRQQGLLLEVGVALGQEFLAGAAGEALGRVLAEAERLGAPLELALEPEEDLASVPWETARLTGPGGLPGEPLALQPNVRLFRAVSGLGPTPHRPVPGPLRVLVAIGSPEEQNERGELLDMEKELSRILDAVEPSRKQSRPAYVRVLERGTAGAIREALEGERYHVLHITCHAAPGVLVLEKEDGGADLVDPDRFCDEALVPGRGVPVVLLAGCATALGLSEKNDAPGEAALPGFARQLLARGVPAVVAMQAPVSDLYATELGARFYRALAIAERPDPLVALVDARRSVETDRRRGRLAGPIDLAEWATPTVWLRGPSLPLYDPEAPFEEIRPLPEPRLADRIVVRRVGEFVGRRREKRQILEALARQDRAGVVLHGLGGVGKSSLSAEVIRKILESGWLVASVHGEISPDDILEEVGKCYLAALQQEGVSERDPRRQIAANLRRPDFDWEERFELLSRTFLGNRPLLLLVDNFEDNLVDGGLGPALKDQDLADLVARWVRQPGLGRFLFTSRPPFELPDRAHRRLEYLHLGPLSFAETRKLLWRLPGLDTLSREDQLRAYTDVGGHPRALEYLDALLRGGESRFPDVAERMEMALEKKGVPHPDAWLRRAKGNFNKALAETVTLAVDDVLLDRLLEKLEGIDLAREMLLGASVYRIPVDLLGLAWQVGEEIEIPRDQERGERLHALTCDINRTRERGEELSPELIAEYEAEMPEWKRPPLVIPEAFSESLERLEALGLVAPVEWNNAPEEARRAVHRWTASAVLRQSSEDAVWRAHQRAARHWRWRAERLPQSRQEALAQRLEARYHFRETGDVDQAVEMTGAICSQLDTWGAYRREEQLCREALTWLPKRSPKTAAFLHQLGIVAQKRGAYDEALDWYKRSLNIDEELGNRKGMATSYHQLGVIVQERGAYDVALDWYKRSLQIHEELGDREGMAGSYYQLGNVAFLKRDDNQALDWYKKSLKITKELNIQEGIPLLYHQLGMIAHRQSSYDEALDWYKKSLQIEEELGNRAGMASSYHQLGVLAQELSAYDKALEWYKRSLQIEEELGNRAGVANSISQIGMLATLQGRPEEGLALNLQSLAIRLELQVPQVGNNLHWLGRQRDLLGEERFFKALREQVGEKGAEAVLGWLAQLEENTENDR